MNLTIAWTFLPHTDADASVVFYRDVLGFEIRKDVGSGRMRWITVGPADQPGTSIVLHPPAIDPDLTDDERRTIMALVDKGRYATIVLATDNVDTTFDQLKAAGGEVLQEPTKQPYGIYDCAFRDPAGNMIRINQVD
jgi:predicted enzyme related to lactoylglutathione lyase